MTSLKNILLFTISFALTALVSEIFIRNTKITELSFAEFYSDIGKGIPKNKEYVFFNEGFGIVSTNKDGIIGNDIGFQKDTNTIRIALLGDSYIEATQVFERHYFGNIAEQIIQNNIPNKKIEIINFGRSSFNLGRMYSYQIIFVDKFSPDYILYFLANDDLNADYTSPPLLPKTIIKKDSLFATTDIDTLKLNQYQDTKFLNQNFAIFNILNSCRYRINNGETFPILFDKFYLSNNDRKDNKTNEIKPYILDEISTRIIENLDSNCIIVNRDREYLPESFKILCQNNNLSYLDLSINLDSLENAGKNPEKWEMTNKIGHWNHLAHATIGKKVAEMMIKKIKPSNFK